MRMPRMPRNKARGLNGRTLVHLQRWAGPDGHGVLHEPSQERPANAVTSLVPGSTNKHRLVLDLDIPHTLVPSGTPGHSHLELDHEMTWEQAVDVLGALARAGIIEQRWFEAALRDGATVTMLPESVTGPKPRATATKSTSSWRNNDDDSRSYY